MVKGAGCVLAVTLTAPPKNHKKATILGLMITKKQHAAPIMDLQTLDEVRRQAEGTQLRPWMDGGYHQPE